MCLYMFLLCLYQLRMTVREDRERNEGVIPSLKCVRSSSGNRNSVGMLQANWWSKGAMIPVCVVDLEEDSWRVDINFTRKRKIGFDLPGASCTLDKTSACLLLGGLEAP